MYNSNCTNPEVFAPLKQKQSLDSSKYNDLVNHFSLLSQTWYHTNIFPSKNRECALSFFIYIPLKPQKNLSRLI